jgi:hypothetical protein
MRHCLDRSGLYGDPKGITRLERVVTARGLSTRCAP